ncbi:hypothetical protein Acr_04g0006560 [Actinidia rufa]|uniref:DYW domain-containing protein n=1 Tax=Actinidia rufa TaxID=165716 RepID=A0A7J0EHH1_9ERIC|nr:hypothetical protein Acr_04g0006560 [Actinidia rufa]
MGQSFGPNKFGLQRSAFSDKRRDESGLIRLRPTLARILGEKISFRISNHSRPRYKDSFTLRFVSDDVSRQCLCEMWGYGKFPQGVRQISKQKHRFVTDPDDGLCSQFPARACCPGFPGNVGSWWLSYKFTLGIVLNSCLWMQNIELGKQIHSYLMKYEIESNASVGNALRGLYSKCGNLNSVVKAFSQTGEKNVISWTTVISSGGDNGDPAMGLSLFREMISEGIEPNEFTLTSILSYAQMIGLAEDGLSAYCSGVEALNIFLRLHRSGTKPDLFTFSSILTICSSLVAFQQGEQVHAQTIKTVFLADVVVGTALVNMYNKRESRVRVLCRRTVGQTPSKKSRELLLAVEPVPLDGEMDVSRTLGYESQGALEVTEDDDEGTTFSTVHPREKLPVTFGLVKTPNAAPIRVINSISMCQECHSFIKYVSALTAREIIVRDSKRLHKFVNGDCLCGDFGSLI